MSTRSHYIGRHRVELRDDVIVTRVIGDFTLDDMKAFYQLVAELSRGSPLYSIADMRQAGTIGPAARRYAIAEGPRLQLVCNVVFGESRLLSALFILLGQAAKLVGRMANSAATTFVASETEAVAYVNAARERRRRGAVP